MMHGFGFGDWCGAGWFGGGALSNLGWGGWIIGLVFNLALIIGVVLLVIWVVRRLTASPVSFARSVGSQESSTAREILQARYARGEIDREQYQQMLNDLS